MSAPDALSTVRIAVDCMGGDHGPAVTLPACRAFLDRHPGAELLLVGRPDALARGRSLAALRTIVAASEVVAMDDPVEVALRRKKDSSMRVAIGQLKPGGDAPPAAHACVSAGNTGALMALARYLLKTLDGIDRPAIATQLPEPEGRGDTTVLDLGANVDCTAEHLLQFAVMGSALVAAVEGRENPSVGLLNIGEEAIKGSETIKRAGELLREAASHRSPELPRQRRRQRHLQGHDGHRGVRRFRRQRAAEDVRRPGVDADRLHPPGVHAQRLRQVCSMVALPVLKHFKRRVDPRRYNGAALLGLRGLVFKSHGSADAFAFEQALNRACEAARNRLLDRVHDRILETLQALPAPSADEPADPSRMNTTSARYTAHRRHRQLPAAAPRDERRAGAPAGRAAASRPATTGSSSAPASARAISPPPTWLQRSRRRARRAARSTPPDCEAGQVDLIIVATSTPDMVFPSTACIVQRKLGIAGCPAFDVQAVCSGFVYGLSVADAMIRTGAARKALVIGSEVFSRILDFNDRTTCVLFGDGAGAVLLEASDTPGLLASALHADGRHIDILCTPGTVSGGAVLGDPLLKMDGQAVFKLAVGVLDSVAREVLEKAGRSAADIDWLIPHQANIRIMQSTAKKLRLPAGQADRDGRRARQHLGRFDPAGVRRRRARRQAAPRRHRDARRRRRRLHLGGGAARLLSAPLRQPQPFTR